MSAQNLTCPAPIQVVLAIEQLAHSFGQRGHLVRRQKSGLEKKTVFLKSIQLLVGQRAGQVAAFYRMLPALSPGLFRVLVQPGGVGIGLYRGTQGLKLPL